PGIELSADPTALLTGPLKPRDAKAPSPTLHLLGYDFDAANAELLEAQRWLVEARGQRNPRLVGRLAELGVAITYDEVLEHARSLNADVVTRPHIAQILVRKGYVKSIHAAFTKYIGEGAPAYVPKQRLQTQRAIELVQRAGGVAVLAHPVQLRFDDDAQMERFVRQLKEQGLDGIESHHSDHTRKHVEAYTRLAEKLDLLTTAGSDYHGARKQVKLGSMKATQKQVDAIRQRAARRMA
ncbi:MAG: hypothetical protein MI741_03590, partial [Rhodospirillales bacterium]|nr:hypothetical protein [Rhodospirillales bacterium]